MALLKKFSIGIAVLVILFVGVGFILPSEFRVERSITIDAPAENIFARVGDLKEWKKWGIWFKRDPDMQITYSGPERGVGMKSVWISAAEGSGEMEVIALVPNQKLTYSLYFPEFDMSSTGEFTLTENNGKTTVVWADYGDVGSNPLNHYFAAMMDSMIGGDFEAGLDNLKTLVENQN